MSYNQAYTAQFHGTDGTPWTVEIDVEGFLGNPQEILLEYDEPVVIEWEDTGVTDVVQSSTCTLKVSNEKDRQMALLLTNRDAMCTIRRNNHLYWRGMLDDSVYEEPYSFKNDYVTELVFSDFGFLNRVPFEMSGKQSLHAIVNNCLASAHLDQLAQYPWISLYLKGDRVNLGMLYMNADRFTAMTKRDVLEEVLRPLGLRIMQKDGGVYIYDIEYMRDNGQHPRVIWDGTDAYINGSETYGKYKVSFDIDADEIVLDGSIEPDRWNYPESDRYYAEYREKETDPRQVGFYLELPTPGSSSHSSNVSCARFRTRSHMSTGGDYGYALRARCFDSARGLKRDLLETTTQRDIDSVTEIFHFESGYLPLVTDERKFQLRVNLDFLLSPKINPFEDPDDCNLPSETDFYGIVHHFDYEDLWKDELLRIYIPVKLEIVDEDGNILRHYKNTNRNGGYLFPMDPYEGEWLPGEGEWGEMLLAYYKPGDDGHLTETALDGWATNKASISRDRTKVAGILEKRADGEYVPLPPLPGKIRFTVSDGVVGLVVDNEPQALLNCDRFIHWQLYRNPKITIVKAGEVEDEIYKDDIVESQSVRNYVDQDMFDENAMIGCLQKDVSPTSKGLLFSQNGFVFTGFFKNGEERTLASHRLRCVMNQTATTQPEISGTAALRTGFFAYTEGSSNGVFLVTGLRQDLRSATEHVKMARIADVGDFVYEFGWSLPVCSMEEPCAFSWSEPECAKAEPSTYAWSDAFCALADIPYSFSWNSVVCSKHYRYTIEWEPI